MAVRSKRAGGKSDLEQAPDWNARAAAALFDLAAAQDSKARQWGYQNAAGAIFDLDAALPTLVRRDGSLPRIPRVGPSSARILVELLEKETSPLVEKAVAASSRRDEIARSRRLRENFLSRARVVEILSRSLPPSPSALPYLGDFQMHSVWSDGSQTLEEIVEGGLARGYSCCAITDHYSLPIAGGLSLAELGRQRQEIARLNRRLHGRFRLLQGVEANILADGEIDLPLAARRRVELVVAAPHSQLRSDESQTARMLAAVRSEAVSILGHPRGRKYGVRPGVSADWESVFAAAADAGIAVELDGDPQRQDLDFALARRALAAGCLFAIDSDAHATEELRYAETALAHAHLAGIPADRIINFWPLPRFLAWLEERRSPIPLRRA
jgi:histidinol phosphatase-like PHP family hydrolase